MKLLIITLHYVIKKSGKILKHLEPCQAEWDIWSPQRPKYVKHKLKISEKNTEKYLLPWSRNKCIKKEKRVQSIKKITDKNK